MEFQERFRWQVTILQGQNKISHAVFSDSSDCASKLAHLTRGITGPCGAARLDPSHDDELNQF